MARRIVHRATASADNPGRVQVYGELRHLIDHYWQESLDLVGEYGVLPRRRDEPRYKVASAWEIGLRYIVDRAEQRQLAANRSDRLIGGSGLLRRFLRTTAWFLGGAARGARIGWLLSSVDSVYALSTNVISINGDSRHFYERAGRAAVRLADTAPVRVREALLHEIAHANFAAAAPALARVPGLERSPNLRAVLEGYPTWVTVRIASRVRPETGQPVDPELNAWQWVIHPPERPGTTAYDSPYRQGAAWFERIYRLYGEDGVRAVARLSEDQLPKSRYEWSDVETWGDRNLGVPRL